MKKIVTLSIICSFAAIAYSQNFGVDKPSPVTKLDVNGGIMRTNTRVSSSQSFPIGRGEGLFPIDPTWTDAELKAYFNSSSVSWTNDASAPGGWAIQISGPVNVGGVYNSGFPYIPIEDGTTYFMECWIKNSSGSNTHYMGSIDYDHNFSSLGGNPGSYGYWTMSNYNPGSSWVKVSGSIGGFGTSTGTFVSGSKYWTPQALFNYTGGGTCVISGWKVTKSGSSSTGGRANFFGYLTNASSIVSANAGYAQFAANQNTDVTVFEVINSGSFGIRIKKPGIIMWNYDQDILTAGAVSYSHVYAAIDGTAKAYSLIAGTNSQWDGLHLGGSYAVTANQVLTFNYGSGNDIVAMDNAPWGHLSIIWLGQ